MRHFGIKPLAAPALTMRGRHVGLCSCLVDEHEMLGIELLPGLLASASARPRCQAGPARRRARFFLKVIFSLAKKRQIVPYPTRTLRAASSRLRLLLPIVTTEAIMAICPSR